MDITFDLYRENSIKSYERYRRSKVKGIATDIYQLDQPLPVKMNKFWPLPVNKVSFQQISSNGLKSVRRMTAVLSSLVVHTKKMRNVYSD